MMPNTPNLPDVFGMAFAAYARRLHTGIPARVERYDSARQAIDAKPLVKRGYFGEDGERAYEELPVVTDVPVVFPGAGAYTLMMPVAVGDTVWLSFSEASLDEWLQSGRLVEPLSERRHALTDAVAHIGLRDFSHRRSNAPTDHARLGHDSGAAIELRQADIRIGGGAGHEATIKADTYRTAEDVMLNLLSSAVALISNIPGLTAPQLATVAAAVAGITAFTNGAAAYKTTIAKVK
jgi:hypothetical protein